MLSLKLERWFEVAAALLGVLAQSVVWAASAPRLTHTSDDGVGGKMGKMGAER